MVEPLTGRRLAAVLAAAQVEGRVPSIVGGVIREGALVWSSGDLDLQYRIGSITKTFTAVLVMQLRNEGLVSLGDPVDKHLPGIGYADRTIRSLLSHSSGMQSEPAGPWWERSPGGSFDDLAAAIDESNAPFEPGATFHYTNLASALLGEAVARLRGKPWWDCVVAGILEPLDMTRTTYDAVAPHAQGYSVHPFANTLTEEPHQDTVAMAPAGQAWSTVADLARYATFLVSGHADVLDGATLAEMTTPQSGSLAGALSGAYGLGLRLVSTPRGMVIGHTGSMPGFQASLFVDRGRATGAVVLANSTTGLATESITPALLGVLEEWEPTIPPAWTPAPDCPPPVLEILGLWHWGNTGFVFTWNGGEVVVAALRTGEERETFAYRDGELVGTSGYHHGETLDVVRNEDGNVDHLVVATFLFTRTPYDPGAPIPGGPPESGPSR
jgi:CubicO group peptidase (beta-lactamase class C family)